MSSKAEHEFCGQVVDLAQSMDGLLAHWCGPDSRKCAGDKGFPDVLVIGPRGLLLAECKMPDGETSADQDLWLWTLGEAADYWNLWQRPRIAQIWFPVHLEDGTIQRELRKLQL